MNTLSFPRLRIILALAALCISTITSFAFTTDGVYAVTPLEAKRNLYGVIQNTFDSTTVSYTIGEFKLLRGTSKTPIFFMKEDLAPSHEHGATGSGVDNILSNKFVTQSFIPSSGDSVSYYRDALIVPAGCEYIGTEEEPPTNVGPYPSTWKTYPSSVMDTSVFVVRVEKMGDSNTFSDIDSVVIYPNGNSQYVQHIGTAPDAISHTRGLPSSLVGSPVRIRVIVKRYGSTPVGMDAQYIFARFAYSATRVRSMTTNFKLSPSQVENLEAEYYAAAESYIDGIAGVSNDFPSVGHLRLPDSTFHRIMSKHYTIEQDANDASRHWYTPKKRYLDTSGLYLQTTSTSTGQYVKVEPDSLYDSEKSAIRFADDRGAVRGIVILGARFNPAIGSITLNVVLPAQTTELAWIVTNIQGKELDSGLVWPAFNGRGELQIPYLGYGTSPYYLTVISSRDGSRKTLGITPP